MEAQPRMATIPTAPSPRSSLPQTKLQFAGTILEITQPSQVAHAIALLRKDALWTEAPKDAPTHYVGFDMEWRPEFVPGQSNPVALIQVASERVCLLFFMMRLRSMPKELEALLLDRTVLKLGLNVYNDLKKLRAQYRLVPQGLLDVANMAHDLGFSRLGLQSLALELLGVHIPKGQTRSNWASRELTAAQLLYAATDPYVTLLIYNELEAIEVEEDRAPYWTIAFDYEESAAAALEQESDPRLQELLQSVKALTRSNADVVARLAAVEAESQRTRAVLECRISVLEAENRRIQDELIKARQHGRQRHPQLSREETEGVVDPAAPYKPNKPQQTAGDSEQSYGALTGASSALPQRNASGRRRERSPKQRPQSPPQAASRHPQTQPRAQPQPAATQPAPQPHPHT